MRSWKTAGAGLAGTTDGPLTEIIARAKTENGLAGMAMTRDLSLPVPFLLRGIGFSGEEEERRRTWRSARRESVSPD